MTHVEERLGRLLRSAAPESPDSVDFADVANAVRRRHRSRVTALVTTIVLVVAGAAVTATALAGGTNNSRQELITRPSPTPRPVPAAREISFQGVRFSLPAGWTTSPPLPCGARQDRTVALGDPDPSFRCPYKASQPVTSVAITPVYGQQFAGSWFGRQITFHGQPAWLAEYPYKGLATATLTLPRLNATITATSPSAATARALINQVSVAGARDLGVPEHASSVFIETMPPLPAADPNPHTEVTSPADVQQVLADLRSLPLTTAVPPDCNRSWFPGTALITVTSPDGSQRTYAAQFTTCHQVISGTGVAASTSTQLLADIRRLIPDAGI